jgi:glutamyl-tRNA reductase
MGNELIIVGVSHRTTPVEVRERLAVDQDRCATDLHRLVDESGLTEAVLVSTCNRVELIASTRERAQALRAVTTYFNERVAPASLDGCIYEHTGAGAVRHLFRVASGLDSMVLGEPQILGQVKDAFTLAHDEGTVGTLLGRCFDRGFKVAKRVRSETSIAEGNVSVSSIACDLAEKIFGDLAGRAVLLVGAGKMGESAARSLAARGARLTVINRDPTKAARVAAACQGEARPMEALATELSLADVVITSTSKPDFLITPELMEGVGKMRRWKPIFFIDIAVPRDVDPRIGSLRNVFLYDVDDLEKVSRENLSARQRAATDAERIVDAEVVEFERWMQSLSLSPTIVALREKVRGIVQAEKHKVLPRLEGLSPLQSQALDRMCESIVNQLLHRPLTELKQGGEDAQDAVLLVQRLFGLTVDPAQPTPSESAAESELEAAGRRRT